jgi:hypothetical protein
MVFMAVNGKQQIGNEACQDLYHQAVATSCNQINFTDFDLLKFL